MKLFSVFLVTLVLMGIGIFQIEARKRVVLGADYKIESVKDEVDLDQYFPFGTNNKLYTFKQAPNLAINDNYPLLDGATAAYPIYAAAVQGIYKGLNVDNVEKYVQCNTTPTAYERLMNKEVDAIFVAEPSKKQLEMAKSKGVKLKLIPIGREAFVFFVNKKNKVNSLSVTEIQGIYTKEITNWKSVGGKNKRIMPFQRPENSGSQTIMENKIMKGIQLAKPLREEYSQFMGEIVDRVADYRNYDEAIGYSFRYYASGMNKNENIKLLAINGIEPTAENIRNGKYPYTVDVYLVTREDVKNPKLDSLINWFLSKQGQEMVESVGYVGNN
ncbi:MAG: substrate-binding domain-containing protein [Sebaldella sp.]|nr:substrate-binding domain-containing protein [Sebaldella sp.]